MKDVTLNGGVLVIGSLLWDDNVLRTNWRGNYLFVNDKIQVPAPIRYGRLSRERSNTYTMVFSEECNNIEKLGNAFFIPFNNNPVNIDEIKVHSTELIKSECKMKELVFNEYNWNWGALGISVKPSLLLESSDKFSQVVELLKFWKNQYSNKFIVQDYKVGEEPSIFIEKGIINFSWTEELREYDFFIATITKPNGIYPDSQEIANKMIMNSYSEYFHRNQEYGFFTFQDAEILEHLAK